MKEDRNLGGYRMSREIEGDRNVDGEKEKGRESDSGV